MRVMLVRYSEVNPRGSGMSASVRVPQCPLESAVLLSTQSSLRQLSKVEIHLKTGFAIVLADVLLYGVSQLLAP
jgi:hypothetical protein